MKATGICLNGGVDDPLDARDDELGPVDVNEVPGRWCCLSAPIHARQHDPGDTVPLLLLDESSAHEVQPRRC